MRFLTFMIVFVSITVTSNGWSAFESGAKLEELKLEGDAGGHLDGKAWSSKSMIGKIAIFFYVDPDEKDKNEELSEALKKRDFSREHVNSYALINMAATWLPNFAISSSLKSKQEKYPTTIYLKDYDKKGVRKWGLADDENNIVIFDPKGEVLFSKFGQVDSNEIKKVLSLIEEEIKKRKNTDS